MGNAHIVQKVSLQLQRSQRLITHKKTPSNAVAYAPAVQQESAAKLIASRFMLGASTSANVLPDGGSDYTPLDSRRGEVPRHAFQDSARTLESARSKRS